MRLADLFPLALPLNLAPDGAGRIFYDGDRVLACDLENRFQVARHAHLVNAQNGTRAFAEGGFDLRADQC